MKRILLLGDQGTGKTTFLNIFLHRPISQDQKPTQGIAAAARTFQFQHFSYINIQIWDTSGSQYSRDMAVNFYQTCKLFVILIDRSSKQTLNNFSYWLNNIQKYNPNRISNIIILANKTQNKQYFNRHDFMSMYMDKIQTNKLIKIKFQQVNLFEEKDKLQDNLIKPLLQQYCKEEIVNQSNIIIDRTAASKELNCTNQCTIM